MNAVTLAPPAGVSRTQTCARRCDNVARLDRPPTWKNSAQRAAVAALLFGLLVVVLFGRSPAQAIFLALFMFLFYIPLGYMTDAAIYRYRQRRKAG